MTTILGFAGKKQSGKNTSCNFIIGHSMASLGIVKGTYKINEKGQLWISDLFGDVNYEGIFDISRNNQAMRDFLKTHLDSYIKLYSFADVLKQDVCIKVLGLTYEQCYGTDDDKNSETHLRWENMPGVVTPLAFTEFTEFIRKPMNDAEPTWTMLLDPAGPSNGSWRSALDKYGFIVHEPGLMTAREVMQFAGTEIFRKMYSHVWVDATVRKIQAEQPVIALICDCRFENEVRAIQQNNGIVVRLLRNSDSQDSHPSETSLDNFTEWNLTIDNRNMSISEQNEATYSLLASLGLVENA